MGHDLRHTLTPGFKPFTILNSSCKYRNLRELCPSVCTFVKKALEGMHKDHLWMKRMSYKICVQCPVCSNGGVLATKCRIHRADDCKRDECLHYINEADIVESEGDLPCNMSGDPSNAEIPREEVKRWFIIPDNKVCLTFVYLLVCLLHYSKLIQLMDNNSRLYDCCLGPSCH